MTVSPNDPTTHISDELRIVVGVDESECAIRAVEFAAREAARWGALLHVVSVYREMPAEGGSVVPVGLFHDEASVVVARAVRHAKKIEPALVVKGEAVLDTPGKALTRLSKGASALVVGTRGRRKLTGLVLGSVSEYVLHHASCTTIVVR
jgi:nucleotide-binding universal stress UspA family protein